jgi:hypothetical protein
MIDHGGGDGNGNGHGAGGINRFAQTGPTLIFGLLQQLQSLGINVPEVLAQLGLRPDGDAVKPAIPVPVTIETKAVELENGNRADEK